LWAPQELHLLPFSTWGEFCSWLFGTVYYEPLIGAVQEVTGAANAVDVVATWAEEMSVRDVYAKLQEHSWPALMVDKSPMNADHQNFLRIAARGWKRSFFVHLFRHPTPAIHSTVYLRKGVSLVQGFKHEVTDQELFCSAEVTWFEANRNIKDVLSEEVPSSMRTAVNYEQFVVSPEVTLRALCSTLCIDWEPQMLNPYEAAATKAFKEAATVFVGDPKLFKRASIDASQADKWQRVTLPGPLSVATIGLARELGYTQFPLQLPCELVWLKPPKFHSSEPPDSLLLAIHPGTGVFDALVEVTKSIKWPSLGLRLTHGSLHGVESIAQLEQRYWELVNQRVQLWRRQTDRRWVLGHSFGCRIAFSFASRFEFEVGCSSSIILMDGRIADQGFFVPQANDDAAHVLQDAVRAKHGSEAADNMDALGMLPIEGGGFDARCRVLSDRVRVLYIESDEPMGLSRVRELATHIEVIHIEGSHVEALVRVSKGEEAHALAKHFELFLDQHVEC
jgi:hypothetical protein